MSLHNKRRLVMVWDIEFRSEYRYFTCQGHRRWQGSSSEEQECPLAVQIWCFTVTNMEAGRTKGERDARHVSLHRGTSSKEENETWWWILPNKGRCQSRGASGGFFGLAAAERLRLLKKPISTLWIIMSCFWGGIMGRLHAEPVEVRA